MSFHGRTEERIVVLIELLQDLLANEPFHKHLRERIHGDAWLLVHTRDLVHRLAQIVADDPE